MRQQGNISSDISAILEQALTNPLPFQTVIYIVSLMVALLQIQKMFHHRSIHWQTENNNKDKMGKQKIIKIIFIVKN